MPKIHELGNLVCYSRCACVVPDDERSSRVVDEKDVLLEEETIGVVSFPG